VELLVSSGRPLKRVAAELGVCANTLRHWRNVAVAAAAPGPHGEAELRRLRRENEYLRRQRDILKKAMSILGEDPPLGMR
jgi:transposase